MRLPPLTIFISSTKEDLKPEREAVREALERLHMAKCDVMERFGSNPKPPHDVAVNEVSHTEVYVAIIAGRYGSGITEEEYKTARDKGLPCFIYFKDKNSVPFQLDKTKVQQRKLASFKKKVNKHLRSEFTSPEQLAVNVVIDVINWYAKDFLPPLAEQLARSYLPGFAPYQLPAPSSDFVGRQDEIEILVKALVPNGNTRIAAIHGLGGVGKTQLALHVSERLRAHYPDAQFFVKLRGTASELPDLNTQLEKCIRAVGGYVPKSSAGPYDLHELVKIYQNNLRGKRALIVLDDALNEEQATPFTPPPGCALLITSRIKLHLLSLERSLHLNQLNALQARKLLLSLVPRVVPGTADRIAALCGYRPLSLQVAGAWLSHHPNIAATRYIDLLRKERNRLRILRVRGAEKSNAGEPDVGVDDHVEAVFNLSYRSLKPETQRAFLRLSVFPASFDDQAQRRICLDNSLVSLKDLLKLFLVSFDDKTKRYHLHDLTRVYADERIPPDERDATLRAHATYFLRVAKTIEQLCQESTGNVRKGLEVFNLEWENLSAGQKWSAENFENSKDAAHLCVSYAEALQTTLYLRSDQKVLREWLEAGLTASRRRKLRDAEGRLLCSLGTAHELTEPQRAIDDYYQSALEIARETNDHVGEASARGNLGNAFARLAQNIQAIEAYKECQSILNELGNKRDAGRTLTNLGSVYASLGESDYAVRFYRRALKAARKVDDRRGEAIALSYLGKEYSRAKKFVQAIKSYEQALGLIDQAVEFRDRITVLTGLGNAYSAQHKAEDAIKCHQEVLTISSNLGDPSGVGTALGNLGNECAAPRDLDQAITFHQGALQISRDLGERESAALDLANLGHAHYLKGEIKLALRAHKQALIISEELDNPIHRAMTLWNLAQASDKTENRAITITYAEEALSIFHETNNPLAADVRKFLFGRK